MIHATISHCKKASVLIDPENPDTIEEVLGTINNGEHILLDTKDIKYNWLDRKYYKCDTSFGKGYIYEGVVEFHGKQHSDGH